MCKKDGTQIALTTTVTNVLDKKIWSLDMKWRVVVKIRNENLTFLKNAPIITSNY